MNDYKLVSFFFFSFYLFIYLFIHSFIYLFVYLFIYLSLYKKRSIAHSGFYTLKFIAICIQSSPLIRRHGYKVGTAYKAGDPEGRKR